MDDIDRTFNALKRTEFSKVREATKKYLIVDAQTFELRLHHVYNHILTAHGWTPADFHIKINDVFRYS
jgi:hypothetical protein